LEAADNLMPGGAVVIDNMEQDGPRLAVLQFQQMNPAWKLFCRGEIWSSEASARDLRPPADGSGMWGVLIAPPDFQIATYGRKFCGRVTERMPITGLRLNTRGASGSVEMTMNFSYSAWPYDYHKSGKGLMSTRRQLSVSVTPGDRVVDVAFDLPAQFQLEGPDVHLRYELEIAVLDKGGHVLLDRDQPLELRW
jgi:hypothetical protein